MSSKEEKTDLEKREKKYFWNIFAKYHLSSGEPKRLQNFDGHIEIEDCGVCVWAWFGVCIASFKLENHSLLCQFVIFKPLTYCFKETMGYDVKTSFASRL